MTTRRAILIAVYAAAWVAGTAALLNFLSPQSCGKTKAAVRR